MTVVITRNTPMRFKGFLCSCMLEVAPGVFVAPKMKKGVRERVWNVFVEWAELLDDTSGLMMISKSPSAPSGMKIRTLAWPQKKLFNHEGVWLVMKELTKGQSENL